MKRPRRNFTGEEKVAILRQHLVEHVPVSQVCEEHGLQPTQFYQWQRQFFEQGAAAFERPGKPKRDLAQERIAALEAKLRRKDEVLGELMEEHVALKKRTWGTLTGAWVPHDTRDALVDYVNVWSAKTEIPVRRFIAWLKIGSSKFYSWRQRYGKVNEHNGWIPRDFWLVPWEREAIVEYFRTHPDEGYRRLAFMMLDDEIVAVSPTTVWRVLHELGLLRRWNEKTSKGTGFQQPLKPHEHWHIDVSYLNLLGTFYYLCSILDGCSRSIVHWEIRESMTEADIEIVLQKARERFPDARPRIISDNGPQFIAKDFKEFIRISGMTHVQTSPYYPQSNGKIERWHQTLKSECIRPGTPLTLDDARRLVGGYVHHYNDHRLHSAIGYIAPKDKLEGREQTIFDERDRKLEAARERRKAARNERHGILAHAG